VTFAGYPGTTGLSAIDYRLTDPFLDPPENDAFYQEKSLRLGHSFWCFDPPAGSPPVSVLPATASGCVTFGCLNHGSKVNSRVLTVWARVLRAVPRSRLLLLAPEGPVRRHRLERLAGAGVAPERVAFATHQPRAQYLAAYHQIDLVLDTFPYNGHTTSLDALWMGVPVITSVGRTAVGRAGLSQLANLGLAELAAAGPDEVVALAAGLAADLPRLAALRATLRDRMLQSPLMDAPRFARSVEAAYRAAWQHRCAAAGR
jgi:predicted O-linked N-acetylglucosamine transferase (SPINDLY family)